VGGLLPICSVENHLVVQERSKSLERIEIWEISYENPSLVEFQESSVLPQLPSALIGSSESSLLVTLGDRHHLYGSVVIGGTKTARSSCELVSSLWAVLGDSLRRSVEESARREHLVLARTKGEQYPCAGAPTRTSGEWQLSDTSVKHHRALSCPLPLLSSIYFVQLLWVFTFLELPCYNRIGTRLQNFLSGSSLVTLGTRGEIGAYRLLKF